MSAAIQDSQGRHLLERLREKGSGQKGRDQLGSSGVTAPAGAEGLQAGPTLSFPLTGQYVCMYYVHTNSHP